MGQLINQTRNKIILQDLQEAVSFQSRALGLMGQKKLKQDFGLLFRNCNWIHTFFMRTAIDVYYIDKSWKVTKIQRELKPWQWPAPVWTGKHVIETAPRSIASDDINIGDQIYVGA